MNKILRNVGKVLVILLVLFCCGLLVAASVAVVGKLPWRTMVAENSAPPNGTPGSAQPGTIGLARPHQPVPVR